MKADQPRSFTVYCFLPCTPCPCGKYPCFPSALLRVELRETLRLNVSIIFLLLSFILLQLFLHNIVNLSTQTAWLR